MAHFARVEDGIVQQVIVVSNNDAPDPFPGSESLGRAFIASLGIDGEWYQTSYNGNFRAHYAGIGWNYDVANDVFYAPQPFPSWVLDEEWNWQAPVPKPDNPDYFYSWDEDSLSWVGVLKPQTPVIETLGE